MSLYYVTIGANEYRVNLNGPQAMVNGKPVQGSLHPLNGSGLHILRRDQQALELFFSAQDGDRLEILVGSRRLLATVETLQRHLNRQSRSADSGDLIAPMPGRVITMLAEPGQRVEAGQTLAVLESMKMQMQLRAADNGRVLRVAARTGDQVEKGALLVRLDSDQ